MKHAQGHAARKAGARPARERPSSCTSGGGPGEQVHKPGRWGAAARRGPRSALSGHCRGQCQLRDPAFLFFTWPVMGGRYVAPQIHMSKPCPPGKELLRCALQASQEALTRNRNSQRLDLGGPASRTVRTRSVVRAPVCGMFL